MWKRFDQRLAAVLAVSERESLLIALVALYTCGVVARLPSDQLRQDGWLALVAGRFVAHAGLPSTDYLTTWTAGVHWVDQQWLAQLILFRLFEIGGLRLVMLTHVGLLGLALALAVVAARWRGGSPRSVALIATPALLTIFLWAQFRTQSFAYPLFVCVAWLLIADARAHSRRVFLVFPLLILWANLHGSVLIAIGLVSLRGVLLLFRGPRFRGAVLTLAPVPCLLASPYGLALLGYYRNTAFNPSFSRLVTEWQRSTPSLLTAWFYILAFAAVWIVGRQRRRITGFETLALFATFVAGVLTVRNTIWFSYLALVVLPTPLRHSLSPDVPRGRSPVFRAVALASAVAVVGLAATAAARGNSWYEGRAYSSAAADAAAEAARAQPSARIFADISFADWLLWKEPQLTGRIAYDARLELLRRKRLDELYRWTTRTGSGWQAAISGSDLLVLDRSDAIPTGHVRRLYADRNLVIVLRARRSLDSARRELTWSHVVQAHGVRGAHRPDRRSRIGRRGRSP
jgi:hypothetical protein